ncbi:MAG TPA: AbrB/MazE/SpoVT family DNA-binding domain-containing protein [Thermoanaerobaculia bacterium]|jgi:antitoxin MazE|nr:AbrB/MazE/SpoVT family DNA-binding domain-containing protein [Thermoanaerobaculia bacterium]
MVAKVQKWGNSQGLRISKQVLQLATLAVGDDVEITVSAGEIVVRKIARPKFDLADLVARIPKDYQPQEISFGPPVGREEW